MSDIELSKLEEALVQIQDEGENNFVSLFKLKKKLKQMLGRSYVNKPLMTVLEIYEEFDIDEMRRMVAFTSKHFEYMSQPDRHLKDLVKIQFQFRFVKRQFRIHDSRIHTILFLKNKQQKIKFMVTSSSDKTIKIWKYRTLQCRHEITEHNSFVNQVIEWEPCKTCFSCSFGHEILEFSILPPYSIKRRIRSEEKGVFALAKITDDLLLFAGMDELFLYSYSKDKVIRRSSTFHRNFDQAFSTTTNLIVSKTMNNEVSEEEDDFLPSVFFNPIPSTDISSSFVGVVSMKDFSTKRYCSCMSGKYCVYRNHIDEEMVVVGDNNAEKPVIRVYKAIDAGSKELYQVSMIRSKCPITSITALGNEHVCASIANGEMFCYDIFEEFKKNGFFVPSFDRTNSKLQFVMQSEGIYRVVCKDNMGCMSLIDMSLLDLSKLDDMKTMDRLDERERSEYIKDEDTEEMRPAFIEINNCESRPVYLLKSFVAFD